MFQIAVDLFDNVMFEYVKFCVLTWHFLFDSSILESVPVVEIIHVDTFEGSCTHEVSKYSVERRISAYLLFYLPWYALIVNNLKQAALKKHCPKC